MRTVLGVSLFAVGVAAVVGSAIYDLIEGWPAIVFFFGGLAVTAVGLTVWRGESWNDEV